MSSNTLITSGMANTAESSRSKPNILDDAKAMTILENAVSQLRAIGVPCMLAPMVLPQGAAISLHAGSSVESVVAAYIVTEAGAEYAGAAATHVEFASKVEQALSDTDAVALVGAVR